jgi:hypothetical protein
MTRVKMAGSVGDLCLGCKVIILPNIGRKAVNNCSKSASVNLVWKYLQRRSLTSPADFYLCKSCFSKLKRGAKCQETSDDFFRSVFGDRTQSCMELCTTACNAWSQTDVSLFISEQENTVALTSYCDDSGKIIILHEI